MKLSISFVLVLVVSLSCLGQSGTHIYLVQFDQGETEWSVQQVQLATGFNPDGYNNQPHFASSTELLISAAPEDNLVSTDIYSLNLVTKSITRITETKEREYSPSVSADGLYIHCVLVDSSNAQMLWRYPRTGENSGELIMRQLGTIGYYAHLNDSLVAEFRVDSVSTLYVHNIKNQQSDWVSRNIGRCLKTDNDDNLYFVQRHSSKYWFIKKWNAESKRIEIIKKTLPEVEDFEVLTNGLLCAHQNKLFYLPFEGLNWSMVMDLDKYGINGINRIAYNGQNTLAIVANNN